MIVVIRLLLAILASLFKSKGRLEAENAALRQQSVVLRCNAKGRARRDRKITKTQLLSMQSPDIVRS